MHGMAKVTVAATLVALAFAGPTGASAADGKKSTTESMKTTVSDSWITSKTKIALFADSRAPGSAVNVETKNGMVSSAARWRTRPRSRRPRRSPGVSRA